MRWRGEESRLLRTCRADLKLGGRLPGECSIFPRGNTIKYLENEKGTNLKSPCRVFTKIQSGRSFCDSLRGSTRMRSSVIAEPCWGASLSCGTPGSTAVSFMVERCLRRPGAAPENVTIKGGGTLAQRHTGRQYPTWMGGG